MAQVLYPKEIEKISQNMKVIWFGKKRYNKKNAWSKLSKNVIKIGKPIDIEELLDMKGFENAKENF